VTPPAAAAAPAVRPRRAPSPRGPRRVSGPARPITAPRPGVAPRPTRSTAGTRPHGFALGVVSAFEALARHRLLDRLIRGRTWIGIIAFALIGIVALQLGLLKLNGGIGRALEREGLLQRQNAALSIENSELAAGERVEARAAKLGMTFVSAGALRFLAVGGHDEPAKAAAALSSASRASAAQASEATAATSGSAEASSGGESEAASSTESESSSGESASSEAPAQTASDEASTAGSAGSSSETSDSGSGSGSGAGDTEATAAAPASEAPHEVAGGEAQASGGSQAGPTGE
jgi:hypothetical protein